jgi:hypothetical protein
MRRRSFLLESVLALALLLGTGACGGDSEATPPEEDLSVVVIQVTFNSNVPTMYQVQVKAHLGGLNDSVLTFPITKTDRPIQSGDTMALLIPTTRMGMLDLGISGLDANGATVATGNGQVTIEVGRRVDTTIVLQAL